MTELEIMYWLLNAHRQTRLNRTHLIDVLRYNFSLWSLP